MGLYGDPPETYKRSNWHLVEYGRKVFWPVNITPERSLDKVGTGKSRGAGQGSVWLEKAGDREVRTVLGLQRLHLEFVQTSGKPSMVVKQCWK